MSTMKCLVCGKPLTSKDKACSCCGFHYLDYIGGSWASALEAQKPDALIYRNGTFLPKFDLGVTCYRWKDAHGTMVQASKERLSFGSAAELENKTVWLDQEFARLPDERKLTVEVSVRKKGAKERTIRFKLPAIDKPELQKLGLCMDSDLMLKLKLKTADGSEMVESNAVSLIDG